MSWERALHFYLNVTLNKALFLIKSLTKPFSKKFITTSIIGTVIFWGYFFIVSAIFGRSFEMTILFFFISMVIFHIYFNFKKRGDSTATAWAFLFGIWFYPPIIFVLMAVMLNGESIFHPNLFWIIFPPGFLIISFMMGTGPGLIGGSMYLLARAIFNPQRAS